MPNGAIPRIEDVMDFAVRQSNFSTEDINQEFGLGTRNTAAYLAHMRRRGLIEPAEPARVQGWSQWVYIGGREPAITAREAEEARLIHCVAELKRDGLADAAITMFDSVASGLVTIDDLRTLLESDPAQT